MAGLSVEVEMAEKLLANRSAKQIGGYMVLLSETTEAGDCRTQVLFQAPHDDSHSLVLSVWDEDPRIAQRDFDGLACEGDVAEYVRTYRHVGE